MNLEELVEAVRHCMGDNCDGCPLDCTVCKNGIEAVYVPVELLNLIEDGLKGAVSHGDRCEAKFSESGEREVCGQIDGSGNGGGAKKFR